MALARTALLLALAAAAHASSTAGGFFCMAGSGASSGCHFDFAALGSVPQLTWSCPADTAFPCNATTFSNCSAGDGVDSACLNGICVSTKSSFSNSRLIGSLFFQDYAMLRVSIRDGFNSPVVGLTDANFSALIQSLNGAEAQAQPLQVNFDEALIEVQAAPGSHALTTLALVDKSRSLINDSTSAALSSFIKSLPAQQTLAIYEFDGHPFANQNTLHQILEFTSNTTEQLDGVTALAQYVPADSLTDLNGAIVEAGQLMSSMQSFAGVCAIVIITDGSDTARRADVGPAAAVAAMTSSPCLVFTVGVGPLNTVNMPFLQQVGTTASFHASTRQDLENTLNSIAHRLTAEAESIYQINMCGLAEQGASQTRLALVLKDGLCPSRNALFPILTYDEYDASQASGLCDAKYLAQPCTPGVDMTVSPAGTLQCNGASSSPSTSTPVMQTTAAPSVPPVAVLGASQPPSKSSSGSAIFSTSLIAILGAVVVAFHSAFM